VIPGQVSRRVIADRVSWVEKTLDEIRALPLDDREAFFSDSRNVWAAESCLRRALEALFDLGRHVLAKAFGLGVSTYKEIATQSRDQGILEPEEAGLLRVLAGYRNRLVHFYHHVSGEELYRICLYQLGDLMRIVGAYRRWADMHPGLLDNDL